MCAFVRVSVPPYQSFVHGGGMRLQVQVQLWWRSGSECGRLCVGFRENAKRRARKREKEDGQNKAQLQDQVRRDHI